MHWKNRNTPDAAPVVDWSDSAAVLFPDELERHRCVGALPQPELDEWARVRSLMLADYLARCGAELGGLAA